MIVAIGPPVGIVRVVLLGTTNPRCSPEALVRSEVGRQIVALVGWESLQPDLVVAEHGPSVHRASDWLHDWALRDYEKPIGKIKLSRNGHATACGHAIIPGSMLGREPTVRIEMVLPWWIRNVVPVMDDQISTHAACKAAMLVGAACRADVVQHPYTHTTVRHEHRNLIGKDQQSYFIQLNLSAFELDLVDEFQHRSGNGTRFQAIAQSIMLGFNLSTGIDGRSIDPPDDVMDVERATLLRALGGCIHRAEGIHRARRKQMAIECLIPLYLNSRTTRAGMHLWSETLRELWHDACGHVADEERADSLIGKMLETLKLNYERQVVANIGRYLRKIA